jgi:hypothetical protein
MHQNAERAVMVIMMGSQLRLEYCPRPSACGREANARINQQATFGPLTNNPQPSKQAHTRLAGADITDIPRADDALSGTLSPITGGFGL